MDLFRVGQKVTLYFQKGTNMVEMSCEIEKIYDDRLDLILPKYFMRYIGFLKVGAKLTAKVFSRFGSVDFNTIVISSPLEDNFTIELDYNSLKLTPGTEFPVINAIEPLDVKLNDEVFHLKTFEISTEIIKFYSNKPLPVDETVECTLTLPKSYGIMNFKATIIDVDSVYSNEYTARVHTLNEGDRQDILYFMYVYTTNSD